MKQITLYLNTNSTGKCFNLTTCNWDILSKQGDLWTDYFLILLAIFTAPANLLGIVVLNMGKRCAELNGFKIFAISLAITDLSIGTVCVPMMIVQQTESWLLGDIACVVFTLLDYGLGTVSVFLMTAMAFDRYKCVSSPLSYRRKFRVKLIVFQCIVLWISGIAVWIPGFVTSFIAQGSFIQNGVCRLNEYGYFSLLQAIFVFFIPLIVTIILYIKLGLSLRQRFPSGVSGDVVRRDVSSVSRDYCPGYQTDLAAATNNHKTYSGRTENINSSLNMTHQSEKIHSVKQSVKPFGLNPTRFAHAHISSQNRQCMKTALVVVVCFVVCWGPFSVLWPVYQTCANCFDMNVYLVSSRLVYANSAINPLIYMFSSQRMRSLIKTLFVKLFCIIRYH